MNDLQNYKYPEFNEDFEGMIPDGESGGGGGLSNEAKEALLALLAKVAYADQNGQSYLDALEDALYPPATLLSISAVFNQGSAVIYDTDSLDTLKQYLVVTARYDNGRTENVTSYTLSGTLNAGTSTITVSYSGKTDSFFVMVSSAPTLQSISAVYNGGDVAMGSDVNALKTDLVVTATYTDSSTETVPSTDYTLSGNLSTAGSKTITVSYQNKTTTFSVTVMEMRLEAVFSGTDVLTSTPLNDLKTDLVVTLYEGSTSEVIPSADYSLSGTLTKGTSVVEVSYSGLTTTFTINNVTLDTTAKVQYENQRTITSNSAQVLESATNAGVTYRINLPNGAVSRADHIYGIIPTQDGVIPKERGNLLFYDAEQGDAISDTTRKVNENTSTSTSYNTSAGYNRWAQYQGGTMTEWNFASLTSATYSGLRFTVDMRYLDRAYMYDSETGYVFFAGRNTPYWGMENISEANA